MLKARKIVITLAIALLLILALFVACFFLFRSGSSIMPSRAKKEFKENRYYCLEDSNCSNTCEYGAVNKIWAELHEDKCFDGCADNYMAQPKCINSECVAFGMDGERVKGCTKKE